MESSSHPQLFAFLDVDRCLLDTEKAFRLVREVSDHNTSVSTAMIDHAYDEHKRARQSFNVTGFIEQNLAENEQWEVDILPDFVQRGHREGLLLPRADVLLSRLGELGISYGLLTYGSWSNDTEDPGADRERSIKWQLAKIAADPTLATIPSAVIHTPKKTKFITKELIVQEPDDSAHIKMAREYGDASNLPTKIDYAIVVDDKIIAHQEGDPRLVRGVLVTPEVINNRNAHHVNNQMCVEGLKKVVGLAEAADAIEQIAHDFRSQ